MTMQVNTHCPCCGKPLNGTIEGVYLSPARLAVFTLIRKHPGRMYQWHAAHLYPGKVYDDARRLISVHINDINGLFAATDIRITGGRGKGLRVVGLTRDD